MLRFINTCGELSHARRERGRRFGRTDGALPRLTRENVAANVPPNLQRPGSRESAGSWYQHMMGYEWDGSGKSYEAAKKQHRRRLIGGEYSEREPERKGNRVVRKRKIGDGNAVSFVEGIQQL